MKYATKISESASTVCLFIHTRSTIFCPVPWLKSYKLLLWPGRRLLSLNHCDAVWVFKDQCFAGPGYPCYYNTTHAHIHTDVLWHMQVFPL